MRNYRFRNIFLFLVLAGLLVLATLEAMAQPSAGSPALEQKFFVQRIEVRGSTLLSPDEILKETSSYEGKELSLSELNQVAFAITQLYRKKGYLFARAYIPPQKVESGVVKIYVVEGKIGKIVVQGNKAYSEDFIWYFISPAIRDGMLQYDEFEKALFILNGFPDLHAESFLKPGEKPGTTDVVVNVKDSMPVHAGVDYNNFGNDFVGKNRAGLEIWDGNLTGRGDLLDLRAVFPFPSRENPFLQGSYMIPVSSSGTELSASYVNADIKVSSSLQVLDIRGAAQIYGFTLSQPLARRAAESSNVNASLYLKNVNNFIFGAFQTGRDRLREVSFGYNETWTGNASRDILDVNLVQGLGTLMGGMGKNDPLASRAGADDTFTKLTGDGAHLLKIFGNDFVLFRSSAQWALSPLTITEQFALGGPDSVRGYPQSTFLGDSGWAASGEFRLPLTGSSSSTMVQAAFFVDGGYVSLRNPFPGEAAKHYLSGGGFGLRVGFGKTASARVDLGFPMDPAKINGISQSPVLYGQFATQF